jgi:rhodanese-related sulfurtransferase
MPDHVPEISPSEAAERVRAGALLLDVREHDEWAVGHAPDATHIPLGEITAESHRLPADREIVVICRSGGRSARVAEALVSWGHRAVNVTGGLQDWQGAGLPVLTDTGDPGQVA